MSKPIYGLQVLRAAAAMLVVAVHLGRALQLKAGFDPTPVTFHANVGVDLFFVVSGFVMVHTTRRWVGAPAFLLRRVTRIAPLYWLLTVCYGAAVLSAPRLFHYYTFYPYNFLVSLVFLPSYNAQGDILPPLEQGWTLTYEMFFYVCFALASSLAFSRRIAMLALAFTALACLGAFVPAQGNPFLVTYTNSILLEFVAGCILASCHHSGRWPLSRPASLSLIAVAIACLLPSHFLMQSGWPRAIFWGGPAVMATWGVLRLEHAVAFDRMRLLQAVGDSSFALYLTHVLVLSALALVLRLPWAHGTAVLLLAPVFFAVCVAAGWVCHHLLEQPLIDFARRSLGAGLPSPGSAAAEGQPQHLSAPP